MDAKEFLMQAGYLESEMNRISEKIISVQALYGEVSDAADRTPGMENEVKKYQEKLQNKFNQLLKAMEEIEDSIDRIGNTEYRTILEMRYLEGWSWEDIAMCQHKHERWIFRLHQRALAELQKIIDEKK